MPKAGDPGQLRKKCIPELCAHERVSVKLASAEEGKPSATASARSTRTRGS